MLIGLAGCDGAHDGSVELVDAGALPLASGHPSDAATALAGPAAAEVEPGSRLYVRMLLGDARLELARQSVRRLEDTYVQVARLQSEIQQLGASVAVGNTLVAGYRLRDGQAVRAAVRSRAAEVTGGPDSPVWMSEAGIPIPTLTAARLEVARLRERIASQEEQVTRLTAERAQALRDADELEAAVEGLTGRAAVDAYAAASRARRSISLVSARIDVVRAELRTLEHNLGIAQGQLQVVEEYLAALGAKEAALAEGLRAAERQAAEQQALTVALVSALSPPPLPPQAAPVPEGAAPEGAVPGEAGAVAEGAAPEGAVPVEPLGTPGSVAAKAERLQTALREAERLHNEAAELFAAAIEAYRAAYNESLQYRIALDNRLALYRDRSAHEEAALMSARQVTWPSKFRNQLGVALGAQGELHARRAQVLRAQAALVRGLTPAVQAAGATLPQGLVVAEDAVGSAQARAAESFEAAVVELEGSADTIQGPDLERRRLASMLARIFVLNTWSRMLAEAGDAGGATARLDQARALRDSAVEEAAGRVPLTLPLGLIPAPAGPEGQSPPAQP